MLIPKQLSKRKIFIYGGIIGLMIFGMFFLLYQNQRITTKRTPIIFDIPAESNYTNDDLIINKEDIDIKRSDVSEQIKKVIKTSGFEIFNSDKYKALKEQVDVDTQEQTIGRRNPFTP